MEKVYQSPKELAASRTRILIVDDRPIVVTPLLEHMKKNGKFKSIDIFAVSQQVNNDINLEGGYEQLKAKVNESLKDGENLIILSDYSFEEAHCDPMKDTGVIWTQKLVKDFNEQTANSQLSIFAHASKLAIPVKDLFLKIGAKGVIDKETEPKDVLLKLESESVINRIRYLLNSDDTSVINLLNEDIIFQLISGKDAKSISARHNMNNLLGQIEFRLSLGQEVKPREIKLILSLLDSFSGFLNLDETQDIWSLPQGFLLEKAAMAVSIKNDEIDLKKPLSRKANSFLVNLISVIQSNLVDIVDKKFREQGSISFESVPRIFPFIFVENNKFSFCFANNGPYIDENILSGLGKSGISSKGEGRGRGLSSLAEIAHEGGIEFTVMQVGNGKVVCHNLINQQNTVVNYDQSFEDKTLKTASQIMQNDLFELCLQRRYKTMSPVVFIVSIPLDQVYKK